eukprot:9497213-Pyramimonas_sp.AAC.1
MVALRMHPQQENGRVCQLLQQRPQYLAGFPVQVRWTSERGTFYVPCLRWGGSRKGRSRLRARGSSRRCPHLARRRPPSRPPPLLSRRMRPRSCVRWPLGSAVGRNARCLRSGCAQNRCGREGAHAGRSE